jgi:transmembrane sensor
MTPADNSHSVDEARLHEAAEWLITLREKPTDPQVIAAWLQWRREHPDNPRAFSEIEEIWALTGGAESALTPNNGEQHITEGTVIPLINAERFTDKRKPWQRWSIAAGVAATLLLSMFMWRTDLPNSGETPVEYATAQAAQRELRLSDGSTIVLSGDSAVRVAYTAARRSIELLHGEAHFAVQHDTHRPFVVAMQAIAVTAVGTAFNVRADGARIVVSVSEGVVEVGPGARNETKRPTLQSTLRARAGQQVVLDSPTDSLHSTLNVRLGDVPTPNDWQQGLLSFVDEPLSGVIARVNRYSQHNIVIDDPSLGELHFTGTVFRDRIDDWALGLEKVFPLTADTDARGDIKLMSRQRISK